MRCPKCGSEDVAEVGPGRYACDDCCTRWVSPAWLRYQEERARASLSHPDQPEETSDADPGL